MSRRSVPVERVARERGHDAILRADRSAATIGPVSLLLLVDLDGVVYRGADPVPGVAAVLADRAGRGDDVVYVTNNSMHYRADYVTRLAAMGAPITADTVVSSARATALHITTHETRHPARARPWRRTASSASCATSGWTSSRSATRPPGCTRRASMAGRRPVRPMRS